MRKKSINPTRNTVFSADDFLQAGKRRLELKQIRVLVEELEALPDGAPMPDWSHLSVGDRLAVARRLVPNDAIEGLTGKSDSQLQRYEIAPTIPLNSVAALAAETEIPLEWLVTGRPMERKPPLVRTTPDAPQADPEDVPIQKLAIKAAAGTGAIMLDDQALYVRFPRAILSTAGVMPQYARLAEASGESMKSTINDGDMMLVDVSPAAQQIIEGKIYFFSVGEDAFVKRLRRLGDEIVMISDNREMFPEATVPKDSPFRIFGMVRWSGKFH